MEISSNKNSSSTTWWKVLLIILVVILAVFFIFGLIGRGIEILFKNQQRQVDKMMSKLVTTKVVKDEKNFKRIATYKSKVYFFKHSIIPVLILLVALILWVVCVSVYAAQNGGYESMFYRLGKIIYPWTGGTFTYAFPFGFYFEGGTYVAPAWDYFDIMTLITLSCLLIGGVYYFVEVSGYIARYSRIKKLCRTMFSKDLDEVDLSTFLNTNNAVLMSNNENNGLPVATNNPSNLPNQQLDQSQQPNNINNQ